MRTVIGIKKISFLVPEEASLKDKRQIVMKLRDSIRSRYNVSFAEVGQDDKLQRSSIVICMVSTNEELIKSAFNQISNLIGSLVDIRVYNEAIDVFRYENGTESVQLS